MKWVGWASSVVLVLTLAYQVRRQWRSEDNGGVSRFLYVGQASASTGFLVYSIAVGDVVFAATNVLLLCAAFLGLGIHVRNARRKGTG
jgi:uncharacterized protein with PQ loop repeat